MLTADIQKVVQLESSQANAKKNATLSKLEQLAKFDQGIDEMTKVGLCDGSSSRSARTWS